MARPPKPAAVLESEGRSHRTKAEMEQRKKGEASMLTGQRCFERRRVKADPIAHKEYQRLIKLMRAIGKDDALYAPEYNRYCELYSEVEFYQDEKAALARELSELRVLSQKVAAAVEAVSERLEEVCGADEAEVIGKILGETLEQNNELLSQRGKLLRQISDIDLKIKQKREAMFAIEKENCMTVSAALRTIPKEAEKSEGEDELLKALRED